MAVVWGLLIAFGLFAAGFALHIVGGATDQWWLFGIAVVWIFLTATGYPAIAAHASGVRPGTRAFWTVVGVGGVIGYALTMGALWAANDRSFAASQWPLAAALVVGVSGARFLLRAATTRGRLEEPEPTVR